MVVTLGGQLHCMRQGLRPWFLVLICRLVVVVPTGVVMVAAATSRTRIEKSPMLGRRRRKRAHRVATIPREWGTAAVVTATMMTLVVPRRAVNRPCLS